MLMLGDNMFEANLNDVVRRHQEMHADVAFLVKEIAYYEASWYVVYVSNEFGEITDVSKKPEDRCLTC